MNLVCVVWVGIERVGWVVNGVHLFLSFAVLDVLIMVLLDVVSWY